MLIEAKNKFITADIYVVDTKHKNLLSGDAALKLNLIQLPDDQINSIEKTSEGQVRLCKQAPVRLRPLIKKYKENLFSGKIGKMKNYQIKLHINKDIPPVAQRER